VGRRSSTHTAFQITPALKDRDALKVCSMAGSPGVRVGSRCSTRTDPWGGHQEPDQLIIAVATTAPNFPAQTRLQVRSEERGQLASSASTLLFQTPIFDCGRAAPGGFGGANMLVKPGDREQNWAIFQYAQPAGRYPSEKTVVGLCIRHWPSPTRRSIRAHGCKQMATMASIVACRTSRPSTMAPAGTPRF